MTLRSMFARLGAANVLMLGAHALTIGILGVIAPPEQFAIFLLALSIAQPFATFAGLRLESAFPSINGRRELGVLLALATISAIAVSLLQLALVATLRRVQVFDLHTFDAASIVVLPLITLTQALVQIGRLWAIRAGRIQAVARATYWRAATTVVARGAVVLLLLSTLVETVSAKTAILLLGGELVITTIMAAGLFPLGAFAREAPALRLPTVRAVLRRNWKYPILETPSTFLDNVAMNAPLFLVTEYFGLRATASFGLAFRGLAVPVAQISRTLTEVMQVRYAEFQRAGELNRVEQLFRRSTAIACAAACVGLVVLAGVFLVAEPWIVAERWREFTVILLIISPWVAASAVLNMNSRLLLMLKRQELKLLYDGFSLACVGLLIGLHSLFSPGLYVFIACISAAQVSGYLLYGVLIRRAIARARAQASARRNPAHA